MNRPPPDDPGDDLTERYRRASAADPGRPSAHVRESILAHARDLAASRAAASALQRLATTGAVANEPNWKLRLAGTLAVAGLAGLLLIPFHRHGSGADLGPQPPESVTVSPAAPPEPAADRLAVEARVAKPAVTQAAGAIEATERPATPAAKRAAVPSAGLAAQADTAPAAPDRDARSANAAAERAAAPAAKLAAGPSAGRAALAGGAGAAPDRNVASASAALAPAVPLAVEAVPVLLRAAQDGDIGLVKSLLDSGVSLEMTDSLGRTALMLATINAHANVVRVLLDAGANVDAADRAGATPLERARAQQLPAIARLLEAAGGH